MKEVHAEKAVDAGRLRRHVVDADVEALDLEHPDRECPQACERHAHRLPGRGDDRRAQAFDRDRSADPLHQSGAQDGHGGARIHQEACAMQPVDRDGDDEARSERLDRDRRAKWVAGRLDQVPDHQFVQA